MNYLTDKHIDFIYNEISKSNISSTELKEDLTDHFCCIIEDEMRNGKEFKKAYDKAYHNICPNGFDEIQKETIYLLTKKKIQIMKKSLFILGFITIMFFLIGLIIKFMHWPGGNILLLSSSLMLVLAFLPVLFINLYKKEISKVFSNKIKYVLGYVGFSLLIVSILFKLMHWPGGNVLLTCALLILTFGFLPILFFKTYKKVSNDN